ncbi:hypothetical protein [Novosphingobium lindaniclasticum]|uniref:hypothetical protein n=1 Tax=Novosphingobium lindaniclasticum TaxID=1329895 RepID=UPI00126914B8|nr:hypothetical protein [Novosphingobium lindaniclasticum]
MLAPHDYLLFIGGFTHSASRTNFVTSGSLKVEAILVDDIATPRAKAHRTRAINLPSSSENLLPRAGC